MGKALVSDNKFAADEIRFIIGIISDRIGRKPVVIFGILLQIAGFILAFKAKSIQLLIFARALQGSGAINSVALSWVGDRFCAFKGSRAMRMISTVSSVAIALSLICGTILQRLISIPQIYLFCIGLSALAFLRRCRTTLLSGQLFLFRRLFDSDIL